MHSCDIEDESIFGPEKLLSDNMSTPPSLTSPSTKVEKSNVSDFPLHTAVEQLDHARLEILLESDAPVNSLDEEGFTPLERLCSVSTSLNTSALKACAHLLLSHGAAVDRRSLTGDSLLHQCVRAGNTVVLEALLSSSSVDTSIVDSEGDSPLELAAKLGQLVCLQMLVLTPIQKQLTPVKDPLHPSVAVRTGNRVEEKELVVVGTEEGEEENSERSSSYQQNHSSLNTGVPPHEPPTMINNNKNNFKSEIAIPAREAPVRQPIVPISSDSEEDQQQGEGAFVDEQKQKQPDQIQQDSEAFTGKLDPHQVAWLQYEQWRDSGELVERPGDNIDSPSNQFSTSRGSSVGSKRLKKRRRDGATHKRNTQAEENQETFLQPGEERTQGGVSLVEEREWVECSTGLGEVYYFNPRTQKVQWENPYTEPVEPSPSMEQEELNGGFQENSYNEQTMYEERTEDQGPAAENYELTHQKSNDYYYEIEETDDRNLNPSLIHDQSYDYSQHQGINGSTEESNYYVNEHGEYIYYSTKEDTSSTAVGENTIDFNEHYQGHSNQLKRETDFYHSQNQDEQYQQGYEDYGDQYEFGGAAVDSTMMVVGDDLSYNNLSYSPNDNQYETQHVLNDSQYSHYPAHHGREEDGVIHPEFQPQHHNSLTPEATHHSSQHSTDPYRVEEVGVGGVGQDPHDPYYQQKTDLYDNYEQYLYPQQQENEIDHTGGDSSYGADFDYSSQQVEYNYGEYEYHSGEQDNNYRQQDYQVQVSGIASEYETQETHETEGLNEEYDHITEGEREGEGEYYNTEKPTTGEEGYQREEQQYEYSEQNEEKETLEYNYEHYRENPTETHPPPDTEPTQEQIQYNTIPQQNTIYSQQAPEDPLLVEKSMYQYQDYSQPSDVSGSLHKATVGTVSAEFESAEGTGTHLLDQPSPDTQRESQSVDGMPPLGTEKRRTLSISSLSDNSEGGSSLFFTMGNRIGSALQPDPNAHAPMPAITAVQEEDWSSGNERRYVREEEEFSVTQSSLSDIEVKQRRHLQVWNRFFENAMVASQQNSPKSQSEKSQRSHGSKRGQKGFFGSDPGEGSEPASSVTGGTGDRKGSRSSRAAAAWANAVGKATNPSAAGRWPHAISDKKYRNLLSMALGRGGERIPGVNGHLDVSAVTEDSLAGNAGGGGSVSSFEGTMLSMALIAAVMRADLKNSEALLLAGANPNCVDDQIRSPMHYACRVGSVELAALLFDHGVDIEARDAANRTPLHIAAIFGHSAIIEFLLRCAADADVQDQGKNTPLHLAARAGFSVGCRLLLRYGSSQDMVNSMGLTALTLSSNMQPQNDSLKEVARVLTSSVLGEEGSVDGSDKGRFRRNEGSKVATETRKDRKLSLETPLALDSPVSIGGSRRKQLTPLSSPLGTLTDDYPKQPRSHLTDGTPGGAPTTGTLGSERGKEIGKDPMDSISRSGDKPLRVVVSDDEEGGAGPSPDPRDEDVEGESEGEEEEGEGVADLVASSVWGVAVSLIDLSLSLFSSKAPAGPASPDEQDDGSEHSGNSRSLFSLWGVGQQSDAQGRPKRRPHSVRWEDDGALTRTGSSDATAPPTDQELYQKGLGFAPSAPPPLVARDLQLVEQQHQHGVPTHLSPSNSPSVLSIRPPSEVQVAVAMSRAENRQRIMEQEQRREGSLANNGYSLGARLPTGVSWRYVDVLNQNGSGGS